MTILSVRFLCILALVTYKEAFGQGTCHVTKTYSCDEYENTSSNLVTVGKQGPRGHRGPPGKDCDVTMMNNIRDEVELNKQRVLEVDLKIKSTEIKPRDCMDIKKANKSCASGVYTIFPSLPAYSSGMQVYCDQETDGGGWLVFQSRKNGNVDFYRNFEAYVKGFGNYLDEFWLGLEKIHQLTQLGNFTMRVDLEDFENVTKYQVYNNFSIGQGNTYSIKFGTSSGDAGQPLPNNQAFTTKDLDQDTRDTGNCAVTYKGAWWYTACHASNLNGLYLKGETDQYATGMVWKPFRGYHYSLKLSQMKFRPA